ncbi:hypothetical protein [Streptomyces sp. PT19]|uniref:hypothetical protein n=1 Tax=Streptomyces sp. PT19 TaxID=3452239 RepID=UPI003F7E069A
MRHPPVITVTECVTALLLPTRRACRAESTVLYDVAGEEQAPAITAARHAALHGGLNPPAHAALTA